jgi:hypothetical protein
MQIQDSGNRLFGRLTDQQWLDLLVRSITTPTINGVEMPRLPHPSIQRRLVGSADRDALTEGFKFWSYTKAWSEALGMGLHEGSKVLDFGVGWGRYPLLFWKDVAPAGLFGVDVVPEFVTYCQGSCIPGRQIAIDPDGRLPFDDDTFTNIVSYSVFTHLPENIATRWIKELSRVAAPGCVITFTVEPPRFLDFIEAITPEQRQNPWYAGLYQFHDQIPTLREAVTKGEFCYIPTGGGEGLDASVYGDTVLTLDYMNKNWSEYFSFVEYTDDSSRFWQAPVVARKA